MYKKCVTFTKLWQGSNQFFFHEYALLYLDTTYTTFPYSVLVSLLISSFREKMVFLCHLFHLLIHFTSFNFSLLKNQNNLCTTNDNTVPITTPSTLLHPQQSIVIPTMAP